MKCAHCGETIHKSRKVLYNMAEYVHSATTRAYCKIGNAMPGTVATPK